MSDGWRALPLGEVVTHESLRVGSREAPEVLSSTKHHGLVSSRSFFKGRQIFSDDLSNYRVVEPDWFAYATNHLAEGSIGVNDSGARGCVSPMYTVFSAGEEVEPAFLHRVLKSPALRNQYALHEQASVDRRGSIRFAAFAQIVIDVPPLEEQRRIAEALDTIDETIHASDRVITKLEAARTGAMQDVLSELGSRRTRSVDEVADVTVGIVVRPTQYYRPTGIPILRSANVRERGVTLDDVVHMSSLDHEMNSKTAVQPGDLLTVRTGNPGTTAVVPDSLEEANCVDIVITRPGPAINPAFLALWVNSDLGKGHVLRRQGGLAQQHFNVKDMKALPVPDVDLEEQASIVRANRAFLERLEIETVQADAVRKIRDGLVADLLSGRFRTVVS